MNAKTYAVTGTLKTIRHNRNVFRGGGGAFPSSSVDIMTSDDPGDSAPRGAMSGGTCRGVAKDDAWLEIGWFRSRVKTMSALLRPECACERGQTINSDKTGKKKGATAPYKDASSNPGCCFPGGRLGLLLAVHAYGRTYLINASTNDTTLRALAPVHQALANPGFCVLGRRLNLCGLSLVIGARGVYFASVQKMRSD